MTPPPAGPDSGADDDYAARHARLRAQLTEREEAERAENERIEKRARSTTGYAVAFRLSTEFVSAVVVTRSN